MTDYTISSKLSNKTVYACYRGRFWHWNGSIWKESRIMTHRFERARAADKNLTPQAFLTNGAEFAPLDEYEIDIAMLDALENAKPCKNAPIDPVEEDSSSGVPAPCICSTCTCGGCKEECFGNCHSCGHPVQECNSYQTEGEKHLTPAHSEDIAESFGNIPADSSFDFSALGELSEQAVETDQQFDLHYGTAQDEYLISCIYVAKMHALTAKAGRYGGGTWTKWYESKGMSKSSVWNMLQTGEGFKGSTVEQLTSIPELSRKDLNLIARSGCAEQLTATAGDSQRVQELLAQIKSKDAQLEAAHADISGLKDRATAAEAREEEAWSMVSKAQDEAKAAQENLDYEVSQNDALHEEKGQLLRECEAAKQARAEAEARAKDAENQLAGSRQVAEAAKLRGDKLKAENDALKKQPITGVVDKDEVKRQAEALSRNAVQEARQQAAEAQARLRQYQEDAEGLLAPAQACAQQAQFIADSVRAMYLNWFGSAVAADASLAQMGTPLYAVCGEIMSSLEEENTINPTAAGSEEDAEREALFE